MPHGFSIRFQFQGQPDLVLLGEPDVALRTDIEAIVVEMAGWFGPRRGQGPNRFQLRLGLRVVRGCTSGKPWRCRFQKQSGIEAPPGLPVEEQAMEGSGGGDQLEVTPGRSGIEQLMKADCLLGVQHPVHRCDDIHSLSPLANWRVGVSSVVQRAS